MYNNEGMIHKTESRYLTYLMKSEIDIYDLCNGITNLYSLGNLISNFGPAREI